MLSLGIEASLALRIARSSAGLPTGSPPPSRAATVMARVSLENCAPRRESTIAFLCLMEAHLECPDMVKEDTSRRASTVGARGPRDGGGARSASRMRSHMTTVPADIFKAY